MKHLLFLLLILAPCAAFAQTIGSFSDGPIPYKDNTYAVTLNGNAFTNIVQNGNATVTDSMKIKGYRYFQWYLATTRVAGTVMTMTCQQSDDNTNWFNIQYVSCASGGVCTGGTQSWVYTVSSSQKWNWVVPIYAVYFRCSFLETSGTTDTLTLTGRAVTN